MDDTTEYYMFYEGEVLSEFYQPTDTIAEFDQDHKEYYWGDKVLAKRYKTLLKKSPLSNNELGLYHLDEQTIYSLPSEAGKPVHLKDSGVTLTKGKTIRMARALLANGKV